MLKLKNIFSVKALAFILYIDGLLWYIFAIWLGLSGRSNIFHGINLYTILVFLMFSNFLFFLILAYAVFKKHPWSFYASLSWLILNFLLTLTDQFGLLDIIVLFLNLIAIIYTISLRHQLLPKDEIEDIVLKK